jgi:hypothetical protein
MSETLAGVSPPQDSAKKTTSLSEHKLAAARELAKATRERGVGLTGLDGLLKALTKSVLEAALDEEFPPSRTKATSMRPRAAHTENAADDILAEHE